MLGLCSKYPWKCLHCSIPVQGARVWQLWAVGDLDGPMFLPVAAFFVLLLGVQTLRGDKRLLRLCGATCCASLHALVTRATNTFWQGSVFALPLLQKDSECFFSGWAWICEQGWLTEGRLMWVVPLHKHRLSRGRCSRASSSRM